MRVISLSSAPRDRASWSPCHSWKERYPHGMIQLNPRYVSDVGELVMLMMVHGVFCLYWLGKGTLSRRSGGETSFGVAILMFDGRCILSSMALCPWEGTKSPRSSWASGPAPCLYLTFVGSGTRVLDG